MFKFARNHSEQRIVDDGRVPCPARDGDVDVDVCAACAWLHEIVEERGTRFVRCEVEGYRRLPEYRLR